jgi:predicted RNA-binding protein (virulence factor B family)
MFTKVVDVLPFGAFVDWGLSKDLLVPKNRQKNPFKVGDTKIVRVVEDEETSRLIGVEKITSFLNKDTSKFIKNEKVDLFVFAKTPMGYKAIINNDYEGMLYNNEIFTDVYVGLQTVGYIKHIREDDGKIDLSLQPIGKDMVDDLNSNKILEVLNQNFNELPYNYKTDATVIKDLFGISKKAYKRTLTTLINSNKIVLDEKGIKLKS